MNYSIYILFIAVFVISSCNSNDDSMAVKSEKSPLKNHFEEKKNSSDESSNITIPSFEVVRENTIDKPIKTQVEQHIIVKDHIEPENLRALLNKQHTQIENRTGYDYHENPTNIYLYIYDSMERAKSEGYSWIASLQKGFEDSPEIRIKEDQIRLNKQPEKEKFGFSASKRKQIFKEIIRASDRATDEAIEQEPNDWEAQIPIEDRLKKKYRRQVANKYNLTTAELDSIGLEGVVKQWPQPK